MRKYWSLILLLGFCQHSCYQEPKFEGPMLLTGLWEVLETDFIILTEQARSNTSCSKFKMYYYFTKERFNYHYDCNVKHEFQGFEDSKAYTFDGKHTIWYNQYAQKGKIVIRDMKDSTMVIEQSLGKEIPSGTVRLKKVDFTLSN